MLRVSAWSFLFLGRVSFWAILLLIYPSGAASRITRGFAQFVTWTLLVYAACRHLPARFRDGDSCFSLAQVNDEVPDRCR